jgi:hypothetical protein
MSPQTLYGMKVFVAPDRPKMQLSPSVCEVLAPEFIAETNLWMLSFFGTTNLLKDGEVISDLVNHAFHMNPRTWAQVRTAIDAQA